MFRRRPPRRRRIWRRIATNERSARAIHEIREAHHLLESGVFREATQQFIRLAERARHHAKPQAALFMLKAAKAQVELGQGDDAYRSVMQALQWLQEDERWEMLSRLGNRAAISLEGAGFKNEAGKIRKYLNEALNGIDVNRFSRRQTPTSNEYPEKCSYCGGTIELDYAQLNRDKSLNCSYCGSRINPE